MGEYYVTIPVSWSLESIITADSEEEAREIASKFEASDFQSFDYFYEWLGDEFDDIKGDLIVEEW